MAPSKRPGVPAQGDYYPTVRLWCAKLGVTALDIRANEVVLTEHGCRLYIAAVMGARFPVRVRRLPSSLGRGGADYIVLDSDTIKARGMTLGTVLHECAHAIQYTRLRERKAVRQATRATRGWAPAKRVLRDEHVGHGEPFCRTYARLLRDTLT